MSTLRSRVESNEWWLAHCQKLFIEDNRRNGQYAREQRESVGISLRGLAKRMEISAMMLSDLERGNRTWNASMLTKWEAALSPENVQCPPTARLRKPMRRDWGRPSR